MIGEYERAFTGGQYAAMAPLFEHYGIQLWAPEAAGRIDFAAEHHEQLMLALGWQSKREITRTRIRVRTAMATQARDQGRYLGGRPPYGYRLADAGPHLNKAHAAWGRRAHRLEPDLATATVVRWIFAQRLAGHSGDPSTAALPVQEIAERFVIVLPRLLAQEAARPRSPLAGFAIISSLSQIKARFDRPIVHPYEQLMEATKLLSSSSPPAMELALSMLSDIIRNDQQYQQPALDILCAFLTASRLPADDFQWLRIQVAAEELIMTAIPFVGTRRLEWAPNLNLRRQAGFQGSRFEGKSRFDGARLEVAPKFGQASASCAGEHTWPVDWRTKRPSDANTIMCQVIHDPVRIENAVPRQASSVESPDAQIGELGDRTTDESSGRGSQ